MKPKIVTVDPKTIQAGHKHNYDFSQEIITRMLEIKKTFSRVRPLTIEQWIDGFDRDAHPEKEIGIWLYMADVYKKVQKNFPDRLDYQKEVFTIILACSIGEDSYVLSLDNIKLLSKKEVEAIMNKYRSGR